MIPRCFAQGIAEPPLGKPQAVIGRNIEPIEAGFQAGVGSADGFFRRARTIAVAHVTAADADHWQAEIGLAQGAAGDRAHGVFRPSKAAKRDASASTPQGRNSPPDAAFIDADLVGPMVDRMREHAIAAFERGKIVAVQALGHAQRFGLI